MLIPLASPIGLGATNVITVTREEAEQAAKDKDVFYQISTIDGAMRLFVPVSAIITPAVEVAAKTRHLFCWRCEKVTEQKYDAWHSVYRCECGGENIYIVVTKDGKL